MRRFAGLVGVVAVVLLVASGCVLRGSWTPLTPAEPPAPPPGVTSDPDFSDVSCPVEDWCLAVGAVVGDDYANWVPLAEVWDGSTWTVVDTSDLERPDPPGEELTARLDHVACRGVSDCVAVVSELHDQGDSGDIFTLVYRWDGVDWTLVPLDLEPEANADVDCAVGGTCVVWEVELGGVALWDGSTWSEEWILADGPASCAGDEFCVRVGQWAGFVEHWDGSSWSVVDLPVEDFVAGAVDCSSPMRCVAVGAIADDGFSVEGPLASAVWNGTAWSMSPVPGDDEGLLESVSCVGPECVALGTTSGGDRLTMAYTANAWFGIEDTPGDGSTVYEDLSCAGRSCLAVGWSGPEATSSLASALYEWTLDGIVVNTPLDGPDADPEDGVCEMTPGQGDCSLRAAIDVANADASQDYITIADGVDPVLSVSGVNENGNASGDLDVLSRVEIDGRGATIDGNGVDQVFHVYVDDDFPGSRLTLRGATVTGGSTAGIQAEGPLWLADVEVAENGGPGIHGWSFHFFGDIVIDHSTIRANGGHGIDDLRDFTRTWISNSTIEHNDGSGVSGRFMNDLRVIDSTVAENGLYGVYELDGRGATVVRSTVRDNGASGVYADGGGKLQISESTITGNHGAGAVIDHAEPGTMIVNSTITGNTGPAFLDQGVSTVSIVDSVLGTAGEDPEEEAVIWIGSGNGMSIRGTIIVGEGIPACPFATSLDSGGYNIATDDSCGLDQPTDLEDTDPLLGPLADNGGPTWTHVPQPGSPAIDAVPVGTPGLCDGSIPTDQRGVSRPQGPACDIGSVEHAEPGIIVNTSLDGPDADPGDGVCEMTPGEGDCSLRAAIDETNADPDEDLVTIAPGVDPVLTFMGSDDENAVGDLDVLDDLTLQGQGATVDGNGADRVLHATYDPDTGATADLRLVDVTVTGAAGPGIEALASVYVDRSEVSGNGGRGIYAWAFELDTGEVVITESVVSGNGVHGIDLTDVPRLLLVDTVVEDNGGNGIDLWLTYSSVKVIGSTIAGNGTGILADESANVEIETSTLIDDSVVASGGGIRMTDSTVLNGSVRHTNVFDPNTSWIKNSTIVGPSNYFAVTAFADDPVGTLEIVDSTISGSYQGGGDGAVMAFGFFDVLVRGSVFEGESTDVCAPAFEDGFEVISQGYNIATDDSCGLDQPSDRENTDPLLGPPADNGGPTWTRLPLPSSPAINSVLIGTPGLCDGSIPTDQRGVSRPQGPACDIGAVEQ